MVVDGPHDSSEGRVETIDESEMGMLVLENLYIEESSKVRGAQCG